MNTQLVCTLSHCLYNHLFVNVLSYGVVGTALASLITNAQVLLLNLVFTKRIPELQEALHVALCEEVVFQDMATYLRIGIPNMTIIVLDWTCFEISSLLAGILGVKEQAVNIILLNLLTLSFQVGYGLQQATLALVGRQIGAGNEAKAAYYHRACMLVSFVICFT